MTATSSGGEQSATVACGRHDRQVRATNRLTVGSLQASGQGQAQERRSGQMPRQLGATLGATRMNTFPVLRTSSDSRPERRRRSRTDLNEHGCPYGNLRIKGRGTPVHPRARRPRTPLSMGSPPLVFYHPAACAARGRIFPAPARGTRTPVIVVPLAPFCGDCSQDCSQAIGRRPTHVDNPGMSAQPTTGGGRSWTTCLLLRI